MPQESLSLEAAKATVPQTAGWHGGSLRWKFVTAFGGLILLLGVCVIGIVYYLTGNALQKQVDLRSAAIATNLSDAAAPYVSRKNVLELDSLIAKYGRLDGVAYAYIQDPKGEIVASSLQPFPAELKESASTVDLRALKARTTTVRGKSVYETRVPLLEGQLGAVYVGLWAETVQQDVRGTLLTIIGLITLCLAVGVAVSIIIAGRTIRPLLDLKSIADEISRGHLDTPVSFPSNDEIGQLARSLERMRASLKAAMVRLNKT
jgi:HAMP domain-containing protein